MDRTLLYTVQRVLEKLDLDEVNSINDTQDSILIAREAEDTFYDLLSRNEWPEQCDTGRLESSGSILTPTQLRIPSQVSKIKSLRYNVTTAEDTNTIYRELEELTNEEFLSLVYSRNTSADEVVTVQYNGTDLFIYNNCPPTYFTVFDNEWVVCDSYDLVTEVILQGQKAVTVASTDPVFVMDDTYVLPLDTNTYPLYLAELTAACSYALNGTPDNESEIRRQRGISRLRRSAYRTKSPDFKNYFGRNGNGRT